MFSARVLLLLAASASASSAQAPITAFCAGGVTGGGGGMRAEADGRIVRLRQVGMAPTAETIIGRDVAAAARWNAALDRAGFEGLRVAGVGNITCSLRRGTQQVRWALEPPASLPREVRDVFHALRGWRRED